MLTAAAVARQLGLSQRTVYVDMRALVAVLNHLPIPLSAEVEQRA